MAYFPSLPEDAGVRHIVSLNPAAGRALIDLHEAALRNASGLMPADKELNACQYCYGVHSETARAFGIDASGPAGVVVVYAGGAPVLPGAIHHLFQRSQGQFATGAGAA